MNRRECLSDIAGTLAAAGVSANVTAIKAEPEPILLAVELDFIPDMKTREIIQQQIERAFQGKPHPPIVICPRGLRIRPVSGEVETVEAE